MALIYCKNCGKQISDKAPSCPYCGAVPDTVQQQAAPIIYAPPTQKTKKRIWVIVLVVLTAVACIISAILIPGYLTKNAMYTNGYSFTGTNEATYTVRLIMTAEYTYDFLDVISNNVEVYVDNEYVKTINNSFQNFGYRGSPEEWYAAAETFDLNLTAGEHEFKFIPVASDDNEKVEARTGRINVNEDMVLKYRLVCTVGTDKNESGEKYEYIYVDLKEVTY